MREILGVGAALAIGSTAVYAISHTEQGTLVQSGIAAVALLAAVGIGQAVMKRTRL